MSPPPTPLASRSVCVWEGGYLFLVMMWDVHLCGLVWMFKGGIESVPVFSGSLLSAFVSRFNFDFFMFNLAMLFGGVHGLGTSRVLRSAIFFGARKVGACVRFMLRWYRGEECATPLPDPPKSLSSMLAGGHEVLL